MSDRRAAASDRRLAPAIAVALLCPAAPGSAQSTLAQLHHELMTVVQGAAQPVAASPSLCHARGAALAPAPPVAHTQTALQQWYFGANAWVLDNPAVPGIVTRATSLASAGQTFGAPEAEHLRALLDRTTGALTAETEALRRLWLHSLAWEIGLPSFLQGGASPLACAAARLFERSQLAPESIAELPATLARLGELAQVPEITPLQVRLLAQDRALHEVWPPSDSHAEALLGRFTPRVFLTGATAASAAAIAAYLRDPRRSYLTMGRLPLLFDHLVAVLVLYWNVVDQGGAITPTEHVAFWQQYTFRGRMRLDAPDLVQAEDRLSFRTIRYRLDPLVLAPRYELAPQDSMAHKTFVEAMPALAGAPVTVLRAVCLKCHTRVVETFHPNAQRAVALEEPFARRGRELLAPYFASVIEPRLRSWQESCAPGRNPAAPGRNPAAPRPRDDRPRDPSSP